MQDLVIITGRGKEVKGGQLLSLFQRNLKGQ